MSRTLADAIAQARQVLQDQKEPYRYPTADLVRYYNNALDQVRRYRPDLYMKFVGKEKPSYAASDTAQPFPLDPMYFEPVVYYMAGYCSARDDEFVTGERFSALMNGFLSQLTRAG